MNLLVPLLALSLAQATPDAGPRNKLPTTLFSLRQLTVRFPAGTDAAARQARIEAFRTATRTINGCPDAARVAAEQGAELVENASVSSDALPDALRQQLLALPDGRATSVFGHETAGARVLVVCGRRPAAG